MPRCAVCNKPEAWCVCDRASPLDIRTRVLILQHPQEPDHDLGTVPLLQASLPNAIIRVGLSWSSLSDALGEPADAGRWGILYRGSGDGASTTGRLEGIVALDGTWTQAKTLWWRNPWVLKLRRLVLEPTAPGIYGKLRKEPNRGSLSTLEAVALALVANGEPEAVRTQLHTVMRTMCQRARDAGYRPV